MNRDLRWALNCRAWSKLFLNSVRKSTPSSVGIAGELLPSPSNGILRGFNRCRQSSLISCFMYRVRRPYVFSHDDSHSKSLAFPQQPFMILDFHSRSSDCRLAASSESACSADLSMSFPSLRSTFLLRRTILPQLRSYHSPNHPASPSYTAIQHKILKTALSLVPSTGFTSQALTEAAKQSGYLEITHNLFPRGPWSLVEYHLVTQREALSLIPLEEQGVGKTIRKLCVERLKGNKDVIGRWQEVCFYFDAFGGETHCRHWP